MTVHPEPTSWQAMDPSESVKLMAVASGSEEWRYVEKQVASTLSSATLIRVERVQNRPLWQYYCARKDRMEALNGGHAVQEAQCVWHGTGKTDPAIIHSDLQDGFMMQYSDVGMWGRGLYFAERASYSNDYAHKLHNGSRQFFLTSVSNFARTRACVSLSL